MAFPKFPFGDLDSSFPGHEEVLKYLISYADHHNLHNFIYYDSPIASVTDDGYGFK